MEMYLPEGTELQGGKYRIVRFISSGGFGCTYEARHTMLGTRLAIKEFFLKDFCNRNKNTSQVAVALESKMALVDKLLKKFMDEARNISRLSHPGIVRVSDVFEENRTAYYVMDFIDGMSIEEIIRQKGRIPEQEAHDYILQVCDALEFVHGNHCLHLDLKPANIMVDSKGHAKLIDFGVSKQYDECNGENTSTLMGRTPGFAPLEQMSDDVHRFMPATDIYALGATLYKMLSGKTPPGANILALGDELPPLPGDVSPRTANAVRQAMQSRTLERPQSIREFRELLLQDLAAAPQASPLAVGDDTVLIHDTPSPAPAATTAPPVMALPFPQEQRSGKSRGLLVAFVAVCAAIAFLLTIIAVRFWPKNDEADKPVVAKVSGMNQLVELEQPRKQAANSSESGQEYSRGLQTSSVSNWGMIHPVTFRSQREFQEWRSDHPGWSDVTFDGIISTRRIHITACRDGNRYVGWYNNYDIGVEVDFNATVEGDLMYVQLGHGSDMSHGVLRYERNGTWEGAWGKKSLRFYLSEK